MFTSQRKLRTIVSGRHLKTVVFSVASFFSANTGSFSTISPIYRLENEGSPRVLVSSWLALHGMILTIDNLCAAEIGSWVMLAPVLGGRMKKPWVTFFWVPKLLECSGIQFSACLVAVGFFPYLSLGFLKLGVWALVRA